MESIPQLLELWPISMDFHGPSSFTLLYRNATTYGIKCSEVGDESNLVEVMQQLDMLSAPDKIPETDETDHQLLVS